MKLYIPEQTEPEKNDPLSSPRKVKKWLASLPQANMGHYTRELFTGLRNLNRQTMQNKHRMEIMEMLREPARYIFDSLNKHFINRTLPLPEKSLKIVKLNQSLLQEMSIGYKIIAFEAANNIDKKIDSKTITTAVFRALRYLTEVLLRSSQIYTEYPKGTWWDIHHLYAFAETTNVHGNTVKDEEHPDKSGTVEDIYKQILMFSLSRPIALRQSDAERVYNTLYKWASKVNLGTDPSEFKESWCFCANIESDMPPDCLSDDDSMDVATVRTIEASDLVDYVQELETQSESKADSITIGDALSPVTLHSLHTTWSFCAKRRFSRADKAVPLVAAIGITAAYKAILDDSIIRTIPEDPNKQEVNFSLEAIPEQLRVHHDDEPGFMTHPGMDNQIKSGDAWDMVAKGNVITETYQQDQNQRIEEQQNKKNIEADAYWQAVNVSAGGFCLRWDSEKTSKAQIGELIAIREVEADNSISWRAGVVRWMQYTQEHGLEIGVQVLSPRVIPSQIRRPHRPQEKPFDCLMLPGIKPLNLPSSLLLPAHAFRSNDKLTITAQGRSLDITLRSINESTGSFTQYQFSIIEKGETKTVVKEKSDPDDFDSVWSTL